MLKRKPKKHIVFAVLFVAIFSGASFTVEFLLGSPQPSIKGQQAIILALNHEESLKIFEKVHLNITFTFGCGATYPQIHQHVNIVNRTLNLVLWRPPGIYVCIYLERNICYNVSFLRTGIWTIHINRENGGPSSNITIWM